MEPRAVQAVDRPMPSTPMQPSRMRIAVVTGASAGVGRAVARALARRGWRLALIAREAGALEEARAEMLAAGAPAALAIPCDVAEAQAVFAAAERVVAELGGLDLWVNNAMATMLAPVAEMTPEEYRRVTEVTYLGTVHGTMAALREMRQRGQGTILQVGSALAYRAIPLQSAYCGAKFAIRGFTDSLRSELQHEGSRIRLTMVQLPAVNTPQFDWSRSRMPRRAQPVPPVHQPEAVAEAICRAAETAPRELWVGGPSLRAILGNFVAPGLLDRVLAGQGYSGQMTPEPEDPGRPDNLFHPVAGRHAAHGRFDAIARREVGAVNPALLRGLGALAVAVPILAALTRRRR
jgi:NAD(P)-dependent dehydrogenase (short-subunit alcohol dehydrogenase family)